MTFAPDLDAYFARIGYRGARSATLAEHFGLGFPPGTRFTCPALDWPADRAAAP